MSDHTTRICVAGGGPAGAALALRLTRLGHQVTLVERARFPRAHVGESLGPGIWPLLDALALREPVLRTRPLLAPRSLVRWSSAEVETHAAPDGRPGLLVDRSSFDEALLECARASGTSIIRSPALAATRDGDGWRITLEEGDLHARLLVDASGRAGWLRGARHSLGAPTLALFAYFRRRGALAAFAEPRIEALDGGWLWGAPIPAGTLNVMAFLDAGPATGERYDALLAQSLLFRECLRGERTTPLRAIDATARAAAEPIGPDFVRVGEACVTLDPLSASGVQSALHSALQASIAIHTLLTIPERTAAALEFYAEAQRAAARQHAAWTGAYYASATNVTGRFWRTRSLPALPDDSETPMPAGVQPLVRSQSATIRDTPVIDGDVIDVRPAVHHPALARPLAWLGGVAVAPLLATLDEPLTMAGIVSRWSGTLDPETADRIARWLFQRRILESKCEGETEHGRHTTAVRLRRS